MEEKEISLSGSPEGNPETHSPPENGGRGGGGGGVVPQELNIFVNMGVEKSEGIAAVEGGAGGGGGGGDGGDVVVGKKKRGRPRKYDSERKLRVPYVKQTTFTGFSLSHSSDSSAKKGRGRIPGSGNGHPLASLGGLLASTAGGDFTPHIVTVNTGEDVPTKVLSLSEKGPRGFCILSANGSVSNVTIRQPGSSGGILTYEGRFEILSLTGSFAISENGGMRSRTGGLSVLLAGPDGRVVGGSVAGLLMAASPIQIVVGSFLSAGYKAHKIKQHYEPRMSPVTPAAPDTVTAVRPVSQTAPRGIISPTPTPQLAVQSHGTADNGTSGKENPNVLSNYGSGWTGLVPPSAQRPGPDINVPVTVEYN